MLMEKYIEMSRLNAVWNHPLYQKYYRENEKIEHDREFCCHQITHLLDVARIAYIKNLEAGLGIDRRKCNGMSEVARLFYECDKRSRNCFACPVKEQCNWSEEEKNMEIKI